MKRVILTGATGFVGANLARRLLNDGHEVHLLVRSNHNAWRVEEIRSNVRIHILDFQDSAAVASTISKIKADWIFHLAAHGAYSWQNDIRRIFDTNLYATINLLDACLKTGFEAFIHTGSSSEYGIKDHAPHEREWADPNSPYACAKTAATVYCRHAAQANNAHIVTLRLYSAFGPYEDSNRLIPKLIEYGLRGEFPPLANPQIARDFIYVDDVCDICVIAAEKRTENLGAIYNIGTGIQTSLYQATQIAQRIMQIGAQPKWETMPSRMWDTTIWVADNQKVQSELGWAPRHTFEQGFSMTVNWYQSHLGPSRLFHCPQ
jgi:nucleoside-diphosphate-sugar epimerase